MLLYADDSVVYDGKCESIRSDCKDISDKFLKYFDTKLEKNIREKLNEPKKAEKLGNSDNHSWRNNNSESLNHVLKQQIEWKSQPLLDLVEALTSIIDTQYDDLNRALVSIGQFRLAPSHTRFGATKSNWDQKWKKNG